MKKQAGREPRPQADGPSPTAPRVTVIDNYDSFTYNLFQYLGELGANLTVYRNDEVTVEELREAAPDRIVISPGPGVPSRAGISIPLIQELGEEIPILGVCLGHQALGEAFGGKVVRADDLMHGKTSMVYHEEDTILAGLESPFEATRYHSLVVAPDSLPRCLKLTAWTKEGTIMGLRHRDWPVVGVQFHPESIMTRVGKKLLENFLCWNV